MYSRCFFKIFSPRHKVHFGYSSGMIYCAIPGGQFTPMTFLISAIARFIIITVILITTLYLGILPKFFFLFWLHYMLVVVLETFIGFLK